MRAASQLAQIRSVAGGGSAAAFVLLCIMTGIYAVREPSALSAFGISNLLNNTVVLALAASGLTIVVLCGELDLSGPGVIAIGNVVVATTSTGSLGGTGNLAAILAIGAAVGGLNGFLVAYLGLQSLAVSLGSLIVCQGVALLILPAPGGEVTDAIVQAVSGDIWAIPAPALIIAVTAGLWLLLRRSRLGVALYAVGADEPSARLSGLNTRTTKLSVFVISGIA